MGYTSSAPQDSPSNRPVNNRQQSTHTVGQVVHTSPALSQQHELPQQTVLQASNQQMYGLQNATLQVLPPPPQFMQLSGLYSSQSPSSFQPISMQAMLNDRFGDSDAVDTESKQDAIDESALPTPNVPTSKYNSMSADEIRKECTRRGLRLKATMKKPERTVILIRHDDAKAAFGDVLLGDVALSGSTVGKTAVGSRTKPCMYRLLNILFCDEFAVRFSESGNKPPRAELDIRAVNANSSFWQDVQAAFAQEYPADHRLNQLIDDDEFFQGIDPSVFKPHSAKKLFDMWKEVDKLYIIAEKKFTTSGQNENEYKNFVAGCGYVLYLRKWLNVKPELKHFAKGGLPPTDEFDTLDDGNFGEGQTPSTRSTPSKGKRSGSGHMESFAESFAEYVKDRRLEAEHASSSTSSQLREVSSILALLQDIQRQLSEVDVELANAEEAFVTRLEEDRALLLSQRQSLMDKLKAAQSSPAH